MDRNPLGGDMDIHLSELIIYVMGVVYFMHASDVIFTLRRDFIQSSYLPCFGR